MELKKSPGSNLENKRGLFFELGLALSLILAILAFSWSQEEKVAQVLTAKVTVIDTELAEITIPDKTPSLAATTPARAFNPRISIIKVVENDTPRSPTMDVPGFDPEEVTVTVQRIGTGTGNGSGIETGHDDNEPFIIAEDMPMFMGGGLEKFHAWVKSRVQYPTPAQEAGIQGRVIISFVVEKDGSIGRVKVEGSPDPSLSEETVKVIRSSPKWTPARQRGVPVPLKFNIPVDFRLQ